MRKRKKKEDFNLTLRNINGFNLKKHLDYCVCSMFVSIYDSSLIVYSFFHLIMALRWGYFARVSLKAGTLESWVKRGPLVLRMDLKFLRG